MEYFTVLNNPVLIKQLYQTRAKLSVNYSQNDFFKEKTALCPIPSPGNKL